MSYRIEIVAIDSLMLRFFEHIDEQNMPWISAATAALRQVFAQTLVDIVPSYTTVLLQYDLNVLSDQQARQLIHHALENLDISQATQGKTHELATWYDLSVGPELTLIAQRSGLTISQVIELHSQRTYQVFALGFAPGFAFMGLVDPKLATPRLATPRKKVPACSLGIADQQTAVYPLPSPGGWNLIGRMPIPLFDYEQGSSLLQPGDKVRFIPVEKAEFIRLGGDDSAFEVSP
ncbi:5-oxoprolinase subunit PxpB [Pseudomonas sp. F1_0610]|uniref:5-oxoprolinase subunit PxpB n=1 Tax=Pseudomonas sp. F1_0610 TaxID=3114284 RepID=UPI0039C06090